MFAWDFVKIAQFTNMSYLEVKELPADEFAMLKRIAQIDKYCKTKEGLEILEDNIRYTCVEPDVNKLRDKYGKEENNG